MLRSWKIGISINGTSQLKTVLLPKAIEIKHFLWKSINIRSCDANSLKIIIIILERKIYEKGKNTIGIKLKVIVAENNCVP